MDTAVLILDIIFVFFLLGGLLLEIVDNATTTDKEMTWIEVRQRNSHTALSKGIVIGAGVALVVLDGITQRTSQPGWLIVAIVVSLAVGCVTYMLTVRHLDRKTARQRHIS